MIHCAWLSSFCRTVRAPVSKNLQEHKLGAHTFSCNLQKNPRQTDRSPIILLPRSGVLPARSDSNAETCSEGASDNEGAVPFPESGCKAVQDGKNGRAGVRWRRNRADRSQESPLQAPPWLCLHLEKACFQKSSSIYLSDPTSREKP